MTLLTLLTGKVNSELKQEISYFLFHLSSVRHPLLPPSPPPSSVPLLREFFGKCPELLQRLAESSEENIPLSDLLVTLFYLPMRHLHEYGRLLLKLGTCFEVVRGGTRTGACTHTHTRARSHTFIHTLTFLCVSLSLSRAQWTTRSCRMAALSLRPWLFI